MCHRAHRADTGPLEDVGTKDITAHLDFTRLALAAQDEGCDVIGYASQAHFLVGCGILGLLEGQGVAATANAHKLLAEHEMGELFKVLAFARGCDFEPIGFAHGDRRHRL
jgi:SAM-dependent MidA family methyltransferase